MDSVLSVNSAGVINSSDLFSFVRDHFGGSTISWIYTAKILNLLSSYRALDGLHCVKTIHPDRPCTQIFTYWSQDRSQEIYQLTVDSNHRIDMKYGGRVIVAEVGLFDLRNKVKRPILRTVKRSAGHVRKVVYAIEEFHDSGLTVQSFCTPNGKPLDYNATVLKLEKTHYQEKMVIKAEAIKNTITNNEKPLSKIFEREMRLLDGHHPERSFKIPSLMSKMERKMGFDDCYLECTFKIPSEIESDSENEF